MVAATRQARLEKLIRQVAPFWVASKCSCGCPTGNFSRERRPDAQGPDQILADFLATVNGENVGVILFRQGGRLSSLEVYSLAGTIRPFGLPQIETLNLMKSRRIPDGTHSRCL